MAITDLTNEFNKLTTSVVPPATPTLDTSKINSASLASAPAITPVYNSYNPPPGITTLNSSGNTPDPTTTPDYSLTDPQKKVQGLSEQIQAANDQLLGESAYRTNQENAQGMPDLLKTQTDLSAKLKAIQNEASAIPMQLQQDIKTQGLTQTGYGLAPIEAGRLRANAIQALATNSLLEASRGNLATAQTLVDRAVATEYDPIREKINTATKNLDLIIKSPEYTQADKKQAQQQLDAQNAKKAAIDKAAADKTTIYNTASSAAQLGADALTLDKISKAKTPEEAIQIATAAGVYKLQDEKNMALNGYVKITGPSGLKGLTEEQIVRMPDGSIYKKPPTPVTTKEIAVGTGNTAKKYLVTYDNLGKEVKREYLGQGDSSGTGTPDPTGGYKIGQVGGQCGNYLHDTMNNTPVFGDTLETKKSVINVTKQELVNDPQVGDILIINTGKEAGHVAAIKSVNGSKVTITESNFKNAEKVDERVIDINNSNVLGAYRGASFINAPKQSQTGSQGYKEGDTRVNNGKTEILSVDGTWQPYTPKIELSTQQSQIQNNLQSAVGADGFVSPDDYSLALKDWIKAGGSVTDFHTKMKGLRNPNNPNYGLTKH